jgi:hypothetical protein
MSPPVIPITDNSNIALVNRRRFKQITTYTTVDRCFFLIIHVLFYTIIMILIYVRLRQFNNTQEKIIAALNLHPNLTGHHEFSSRLVNKNQ